MSACVGQGGFGTGRSTGRVSRAARRMRYVQQAIKLRRAILSQFVHLSLSWLKTEWLLHRGASLRSLSASLTQQLALNLG